jgi:hypothetical protein
LGELDHFEGNQAFQIQLRRAGKTSRVENSDGASLLQSVKSQMLSKPYGML